MAQCLYQVKLSADFQVVKFQRLVDYYYYYYSGESTEMVSNKELRLLRSSGKLHSNCEVVESLLNI